MNYLDEVARRYAVHPGDSGSRVMQHAVGLCASGIWQVHATVWSHVLR